MNGRPGFASRTAARGFVLLLVLGVLVVLSLLAGAIAITVDRVRHDQQIADQRLQGELELRSTEATVLFLLATQRITFAGLTVDDKIVLTPSEQEQVKEGESVISFAPVGNEIRMDGTVYQGFGHAMFDLRADSGKISVNWTNPMVVAKWLGRLGVSPDQLGSLRARLLDYQDPDNDRRIGGAETDQYRALGLEPPPNRPLITALELRQVLGWNQALKHLDNRQLMSQATVYRWAQICINTAPASVLAALPGVSEQQAERVVALRSVQAFQNLSSVQELLPTLPPEDDLVSLFPGFSGTLNLWPGRGTGGWAVHWTLTPFDDGGRPWRIDYEIRSSARSGSGDATARKAQTALLSGSPAANIR